MINALTVKIGGIKHLYQHLLPLLAEADAGNEYLLLVPDSAGDWPDLRPKVTYRTFRRWPNNKWLRVAWEQVALPRLAEALGADVLITASSLGPRFPRVPHAVCLFNAIYYSEEYARLLAGESLARLDLAVQRWLVGLAIAGARALVVQQPAMIGRIRRYFRVAESRFHLMPNACPPVPQPLPDLGLRRALPGKFIVNLIAHPSRHHNLTLALEAAAHLRQWKRTDITLVVAVAPGDNPPGGRLFLRRLAELSLGAQVFNFGRRLSLAEAFAALAESDLLLYPSLAESFSVMYLMAMEMDVPILASDLDFARAICGEAAEYFPYDDARALAERLIALADDLARRQALVERGQIQRRRYSWERMRDGLLEAVSACHSH